MKWYVNGADVTDRLDPILCVHKMESGERADVLIARVEDPKKWTGWGLKPGDTIRRKGEKADTGEMYIRKLAPDDDALEIRASSMPPQTRAKKNRTMEGAKFLQIAQEAASELGFSLGNYGCTNQIYKHLEQEEETSLGLLRRLCRWEGYNLMTYDKKLIVYDEKKLESRSGKLLELDDDDDYAIENRTAELYGGCTVRAGKYTGMYSAGSSGAMLENPERVRASSNAEAARFAKGLLRQENKRKKTGWVNFYELSEEYVPAQTLQLKIRDRTGLDGQVFVESVVHYYEDDRTSIFFRYALEGY